MWEGVGVSCCLMNGGMGEVGLIGVKGMRMTQKGDGGYKP